MATVIKIKTTSADKQPLDASLDPVLAVGELAYAYAGGSDTASYNNNRDRLYIGTGTEDGTTGLAEDIDVIGGKYFTQMLDHQPGIVTASSSLIVDTNKKLDEIRVDNLQMGVAGANTISVDQSSSPNGDINIIPGGTGDVVITSTNLEINAAMAFTGDQTITGDLTITGTGKGNLEVDGEATLASAIVEDLTTDRIVIVGSNQELEDDATFRYNGTSFLIGPSGTETFTVAQASGNTSIAGTLGVTGNTTVGGTLGVTGHSTLATASVSDLTNNRITIAGSGGRLEDDSNFTFDGSTFVVGDPANNTAFEVIVASGNTSTDGTLSVVGTSSFTGRTTHTNGIIDSTLTVQRVTFAGASGRLVDDTNFTYDSSTDTLTVNGDVQVDNINLNGTTISTTAGTELRFTPNGNGITYVNSTSAMRIPVGNGTTEQPTGAAGYIRYNTTTNQYEGFANSAWSGLGGVIDNDQNTYIIAKPTTHLTHVSSQVADTIYFVTGGTHMMTLDTTNGLVVDATDASASVKINNSTISTSSGNLTLDAGATGDGTGGSVVINGNLEVNGTTTTVNSTSVQIDDPIFTLGEPTQSTSDALDRGVKFHWVQDNGGGSYTAKLGYFGMDKTDKRFVFLSDADESTTNQFEQQSGGAYGNVRFGDALIDSLTFESGQYTANAVLATDGSGNTVFKEEDSSSPYGTLGQILQMDASGVPFFGHIDCGTY